MPRRRTQAHFDEADHLVRAFVAAACEITGDSPLRGTSIQAVAEKLALDDWDVIDRIVTVASDLGWIKTSGGDKPHSITVTEAYRSQRDGSSGHSTAKE
jgi:hypothetical protein